MSIALTGIKLGLSQFKKLAAAAPGRAGIGVLGASIAGEIAAGEALGQETQIYIPLYGPTGIDAGIVGYTATGVGFLAGLGTVAALAAGAPVAVGVGAVAIGIAIIAVAVNPKIQIQVFDIVDAIRGYLDRKVADGTIPTDIEPVDVSSFDWTVPGVIEERVNGCFRGARAWTAPRDPLMLDLDGDGLELKRAAGTILFDHDADAIRTGTGWLDSDDGILVRDLDGNGQIDTGRELFGIDTLKANGDHALNGFDALADLDSNADGSFTAADAAWPQVQVWRDLDQDGISDAGELFSLDALGISRIGLLGSATDTTGGTQAGSTVNGNLIAQSASFTRNIDGVAVQRSIDSVDLASNPFYREFTTPVALSDEAKTLPQMRGSGRARDLGEAASLSSVLATQLSAFAGAPTRDAQRALLDALLTDWAQSYDYWQSLEDILDTSSTHGRPQAGMSARIGATGFSFLIQGVPQ